MLKKKVQDKMQEKDFYKLVRSYIRAAFAPVKFVKPYYYNYNGDKDKKVGFKGEFSFPPSCLKHNVEKTVFTTANEEFTENNEWKADFIVTLIDNCGNQISLNGCNKIKYNIDKGFEIC